jgi:hypothetical protein
LLLEDRSCPLTKDTSFEEIKGFERREKIVFDPLMVTSGSMGTISRDLEESSEVNLVVDKSVILTFCSKKECMMWEYSTDENLE